MNSEIEKFKAKNKQEIEDFNKFIEENLNDIRSIIVGFELFNYIKGLEGFDKKIDYEHRGIYKKIRIIADVYAPPSVVRFLLKSTPKFEFNVPCVCGIYKDEPHP